MARRRSATTGRAGLVLHAIDACRGEEFMVAMTTVLDSTSPQERHRVWKATLNNRNGNAVWSFASEALAALTDDERQFVTAVADGTLDEQGALITIIERRYGRDDVYFGPDHPLWPHAGPTSR